MRVFISPNPWSSPSSSETRRAKDRLSSTWWYSLHPEEILSVERPGPVGETPVCSCVVSQQIQMPNSSSASKPVRKKSSSSPLGKNYPETSLERAVFKAGWDFAPRRLRLCSRRISPACSFMSVAAPRLPSRCLSMIRPEKIGWGFIFSDAVSGWNVKQPSSLTQEWSDLAASVGWVVVSWGDFSCPPCSLHALFA